MLVPVKKRLRSVVPGSTAAAGGVSGVACGGREETIPPSPAHDVEELQHFHRATFGVELSDADAPATLRIFDEAPRHPKKQRVPESVRPQRLQQQKQQQVQQQSLLLVSGSWGAVAAAARPASLGAGLSD